MKVSPQTRTLAIQLLLCAADLRLRPIDRANPNDETDRIFPVMNVEVDLFVKAFGTVDNLAYLVRVAVLEDMGRDRFDPKLNDEFVILEAAKRLEEGWCPP